tara:strand:- start:5683 stop:6597 length:915 start_codon:yes stop_codon:yes gene_type:complete
MYLVLYFHEIDGITKNGTYYTVYYPYINYFKNNSNFKYIHANNNSILNDMLPESINKKYNGIIVFPVYHVRDFPFKLKNFIEKLTIPKYLYLDDLQVRKGCAILSSLYKSFDYFLCTYPYVTRIFYPFIENNQIISFYHVPVLKFDADIEISQKRRFLLTGSRRPEYKIRNYLSTLTNIYPIDSHIKYIPQDKYYNLINSYRYCFATPSIYKYIVCKHFEIPYAGSILICHDSIQEDLEKIGFKNKINCLMFNVKNLKQIINYCLNPDNDLELEMIRLNGLKLVKENHTIKNRKAKLSKLLKFN